MSPGIPRALLISMGPMGAEMAGPAIRTYELARALLPHAQVGIAALEPDGEPLAGDIPILHYGLHDPRVLRDQIAKADVIVAQPQWPMTAHLLRSSRARLIFDLYDPEPFEVLQALSGRPRLLRSAVSRLTLDRIIESLFDGHHFICASDKQRDLWIGMMLALGLIGAETFDRDPSLLSVIDEVPFGLSGEPPERLPGSSGPRERFAGRIGPEDEIVLWNGGIWNWLDAPAAVRAMGLLAERRPQARLVFMGASLATQAREATSRAREVAEELGLLDRSVLFNDSWIPYGDRSAWLLAADCAVSTHVEHLETRFAFRTRLLDCLWAALPIVCTRGDELSERVEHDDLGAVVPQSDPRALADALEAVLQRGRSSYAQAMARAAQDYTWVRVAEPLIRLISSERPPRLGQGARRPAGVAARSLGFRGAFAAMNALGVRLWPKV